MSFPDPQIFDSLVSLQAHIAYHVKTARHEKALVLRNKAAHYRHLALHEFSSVEEQAFLEGMGDAFAIAADLVDVKTLEAAE